MSEKSILDIPAVHLKKTENGLLETVATALAYIS